MIATIAHQVDTNFEVIEEIRKKWVAGGRNALTEAEYEMLKEYDREQQD